MNTNSSISSTGRPNSRLREVFIFSPLTFAHWWWGGDYETTRQRRAGLEKKYVNTKKKKLKIKFQNHYTDPLGTRYCLLFSGSQYSRATTTPEHVWDDVRGRTTTHAKMTTRTRENVSGKCIGKKNGFKPHTAHTRKTLERRRDGTCATTDGATTGGKTPAVRRYTGGRPPVGSGTSRFGFFRRVWRRRRGVGLAALSTDQG